MVSVKSAISIFLSVTILFASLGLTVATHYCLDQAVETRILFDLEDFGCGMAQMEEKCDFKSEDGPNIKQRSCCESTFEVADLDSDFKPQFQDQTLQINFLTALIVTSFDLAASPRVETILSSSHPPPLISQDKRILFQSFLI